MMEQLNNCDLSPDALSDALNAIDWEFSDANTQYLTHNIHRYSGKFIPSIAYTVMQLISNDGDLVLDPYVGSGTTLLECLINGRDSIGIDVNPLALLIAKVKTTFIDPQVLRNLESDFTKYIHAISSNQVAFEEYTYSGSDTYVNEIDATNRLHSEWNNKWYQPHVLKQLVQIYDKIETLDNTDCRDLAKVSFSDILRKSSNASGKYPNVMYDKNARKKAPPCYDFLESLRTNIASQMELGNALSNIPNCPAVKLLPCSNVDLPFGHDSIDAIITHPPYISSIPYAEYGALSLSWLGYDIKELESKLTGGKRHSRDVVERFFADYRLMLTEAYRVLKRGKYAFLMVGNPTVSGNIVDLCANTVSISCEIGFKVLSIRTRNGKNRRGNKMGAEYLIFLIKP